VCLCHKEVLTLTTGGSNPSGFSTTGLPHLATADRKSLGDLNPRKFTSGGV
jgi:hypothetical protein